MIGHGCELYRKATCAPKLNYFSTRVVNLWNKLDEETIYSIVELLKMGLWKFGNRIKKKLFIIDISVLTTL